MFGKLLGSGKEETWSDRAKAHRHALREQQEIRNESADHAENKVRRRTEARAGATDRGRKGFGKR